MMSDPEVEAGKYPRLASGQREIGRKVKGKEYLIRWAKVEGFLQSWGTQRHARTRWRDLG